MNIDAGLIAVLLTAGGAPIASAAIWAFIDFLKALPPLTDVVSGREKAIAFVSAIVLVLFAYVVGLNAVPPTQELSLLGILVIPLAIYNIGRLAMAVHDDIARKPDTLTT